MNKSFRVAILGATGAVGTELLQLLESRIFPIAELKLLASERSVGRYLFFQGEAIPVEAVKADVFKDIDLVLASAGAERSKKWISQSVNKT